MKYFNEWSCVDAIHKDFLDYGDWDKGKRLQDFPTDEEILIASYDRGGYDGDCVVLYRRDGVLYLNSASHCSCYGLEGQWNPDGVVPKQLAMMQNPCRYHDDEATGTWDTLVAELNGAIQ